MTDEQSILRRIADKWHEVPSALQERTSSRALLEMSDQDLLAHWERARADTTDGLRALGVRGWYHMVYGPWVTNKKVLEIGQGMGIDGVAFGQVGARMTFVDVNDANLDVVRRVWRLKGLGEAECLHLTRFEDLETLASDYDAVFAFGSLHHIPSGLAKREFEALAKRLKPGGRFVMHAYPHQRWIAEGQVPFDQWGELTDGPGTPWAEWYDARKLIDQLRPARFATVFYCEFRNGAMNCIDLVKLDGHQTLDPDALPIGAREITDAVCLAELITQSHWDASITSVHGQGLLITTARPVWSYAASLPVHRNRLIQGSVRCVVRLRATVRTGKVGVAIVATNGSSLLAEEYLDEDASEQTCFVFFEPNETVGSVVLRNASPKQSSSVLVRSIELFCF